MEPVYSEIKNIEKNGNLDKTTWKPLFRQTMICSGAWTSYFVTGLIFGSPTVLIQQLRKGTDPGFLITDEQATWLSSIFGYGAIPWVILLSILVSRIGRKITYIFLVVCIITGLLLAYFSKNIIQLFISYAILCNLQGSCTSVSIIIISEYCSPKYRGLFFTLKSALFFWGVWVSNAIGTFFHWKYIYLGSLICYIQVISIIYWVESPAWLASKGRFDDCRKNFRWLRGTDKNSEEELEELIKNQQLYLSTKKDIKLIDNIKNLSVIRSREFYMPIVLSTVLACMYHFSGKLVCCMYAIDIINRITNSKKAAYMTMLGLDGVTIVSAYVGCGLSRYIRRRPLLFTTSLTAITFLFSLSLYLYLIKLTIVVENNYITFTLLSLFSASISAGVMMLATTLYGELVALKYRSISVMIISLIFNFISSSVLKLSPYIFKTFGLHGAFFFYGLTSSIFTYIGYKALPETKDKTLEEIEEYFKDRKKKADAVHDIHDKIYVETNIPLRSLSSSSKALHTVKDV